MIIGFCGKAGAGKDTAASILKNKYENAEYFSFARVLKDTAKVLFLLTEEQVTDRVLKETVDPRWEKTPRQLLQMLGTFVRENIKKDAFVDILEHKLKNSSADYKLVTDVRYQNECQMITDYGGSVIHIVRPDLENSDTHASENQDLTAYVSKTVVNDGTIEDLQQTLLGLVFD